MPTFFKICPHLSYILGKRSDIHSMPFEPCPKTCPMVYSHGILTRDFHFPTINQNVVDSMSRESKPTLLRSCVEPILVRGKSK